MEKKNVRLKKEVGLEVFIFLFLFIGFFFLTARVMGTINMINTLMNTAYYLLVHVCLYIMAIAVLAGAVSGIFSEFGVISLVNRALSKIMKPVYDLPGASSLGVLTCYLSDNPAVLTLAKDRNFLRYFKKYQLPALTNIGTAFGMGFIITTTMMGIKTQGAVKAALIGNLGAILGSVVSVRLMLHFTKKLFGKELDCIDEDPKEKPIENMRVVRDGGVGSRFMNSILDGGKVGVDMGLSIIPGVLIICTVVLMMTNGPDKVTGLYTGAANEGVGLLPFIGDKLSFILNPLFGFSSPKCIAVPITALGSAGAAIGLVPALVSEGACNAGDIAVFTAICMCWSGYLSTHIAMMDALKANELTGKAIFSHTVGGLCAGFAANILFRLL